MRAEDALQAEVTTRLRMAPLKAIWIAVPNSIPIPRNTLAQRILFARVVAQMKRNGMLVPGAPDLLFLWGEGAGAIELKRPASQSPLGMVPAGRPSDLQKEFAARAEAMGVHHAYCTSWPEARDALVSWGRLPEGWE